MSDRLNKVLMAYESIYTLREAANTFRSSGHVIGSSLPMLLDDEERPLDTHEVKKRLRLLQIDPTTPVLHHLANEMETVTCQIDNDNYSYEEINRLEGNCLLVIEQLHELFSKGDSISKSEDTTRH